MALVLTDTMRNAIVSAVETTVGGTATLVFATSGDVTVATLSLAADPFTGPTTGTITLAGTPLSDTNAVGGTMAKFFIKTGGTTTNITGTVGTSGSDINFSGGVVVTAGDTVQLTSFTITCPTGP